MGNNSLLDARKHLVNLLLQTTSIDQAADIQGIVHAIEVLVTCEHTELALDRLPRLTPDFPSEIDFD